jgi:hypothetical protein
MAEGDVPTKAYKCVNFNTFLTAIDPLKLINHFAICSISIPRLFMKEMSGFFYL